MAKCIKLSPLYAVKKKLGIKCDIYESLAFKQMNCITLLVSKKMNASIYMSVDIHTDTGKKQHLML